MGLSRRYPHTHVYTGVGWVVGRQYDWGDRAERTAQGYTIGMDGNSTTWIYTKKRGKSRIIPEDMCSDSRGENHSCISRSMD